MTADTMDADKKRKLDGNAAASSEEESAQREQVVRRIVSVLQKDQLASLLVDAALRHEDVAQDLVALGDRDASQRKLFVRGLAWETTSESLLAAFADYGEVEEGAVVTDRHSGKSRGFGFVTFKSMAAAHKALADPTKKIDGRMTTCNLAAAGSSSGTGAQSLVSGSPGAAAAASSAGGVLAGGASEDVSVRKLYVWGLSFETTNETFLEFFKQYGDVEEGSIAFERSSHKSRGFGFVTYKTAEGARQALQEPVKNIDGRKVQAKYAAEGSKNKGVQTVPYATSGPGSMAYQPQQGASLFTPQAAAAAMAASSLFQQQAHLPSYLQPMPSTSGTTGIPGIPGLQGQPVSALAAYNSALASYGTHTQMAGYGSTTPGIGGSVEGGSGGGTSAANAAAVAAAAAAAQYAAAAQLGLSGSSAANPLGYSLQGFGSALGTAPQLPPGSYFSGQ